jgi:hypothetical protein
VLIRAGFQSLRRQLIKLQPKLVSILKLSGWQSDAALQIPEPRIRTQCVKYEIDFQGSEPVRSTLISFFQAASSS